MTRTPVAGAAAEREAAGLSYVATVSFLASRAAPSAGFFVALAGGAAIARAARRLGARAGAGASVAAVVESVAILGPARFNVPLTQAMTAPIIGRLEARGAPLALELVICFVVRVLHNAVTTAFVIWVILGGLDAYAGTYDAIPARLLSLPRGEEAALAATLVGLLGWGVVGSVVQVLVYRRALAAWPAAEPDAGAEPPPLAAASARRLDPRAAALAAAIAFGVLLSGTGWPLLAGAVAWLAAVSVFARGERTAVATGAALAAVLAAGALIAGVVGGVGLDAALRRALRAALLVLVATWLRAAVGSEGMREVARRTLGRLRRVPGLPEASAALDRMGSDRRLADAGRALLARLGDVPARPMPVVDAVLGWAQDQSRGHVPDEPPGRLRLALRPLDAVLVVSAALPLATLAA